MDTSRKYTPEGAEDCLPQECYLKKEIEAKIRDEFIRYGYEEVETPAFEYYDVFANGVGSYLQENMIKFFDSKGRILVLKPDITVPIARLFSSYYAEKMNPKRFFYIQNSYSAESTAYGRSSEYTQAGIELIGERGYGADAEVISLAVKSLIRAGLKDFKIDIGQVGFFKALIAHENLNANVVDNIRHHIDIKNMFELENILNSGNINRALKEKLMKLPTLFGGEEVFEEAKLIGSGSACEEALDNLHRVYKLLSAYGLKNYITVDLGMLHDIGYYSGIIFRGLASGIGFPVLSGGRYDGLLNEFGCNIPATGFALGIKRVMIALEKQGLLKGYYTTDYVIGSNDKAYVKAYAYCENLRNKGMRVVFSTTAGLESLPRLKKEYHAAKALYFQEDGSYIEIK